MGMGLFIVIVDGPFLRLVCCSPMSPNPFLCFIRESIEYEGGWTIIMIYQCVEGVLRSKTTITLKQLKQLPGVLKAN
jgi:hypothetical protein